MMSCGRKSREAKKEAVHRPVEAFLLLPFSALLRSSPITDKAEGAVALSPIGLVGDYFIRTEVLLGHVPTPHKKENRTGSSE